MYVAKCTAEMEIYNTSSNGSVALVVGVTGMVGRSLVESLKKRTAPGSPWTVYGLARRPPGPHAPLPGLDRFIELDALDRDSTVRTLSPIAPRVTHLFWVALAVRDTEEENTAANTEMLANVVDALTASPARSSLRHIAVQTGSKHYYFGLLMDPDRAGRLGSMEVPFKEDSPRLDFPIFYYALEDLLVTYSEKLTWTVHRSSLIFGASDRSFYNILLTLATCALICKHEGTRFVYPGNTYTWHHFCDASDAELLAEHQIWAATTAGAANAAFNCTNGDVFTWRSFWKVLGDVFGVDAEGPTEGGRADGGDWVAQMKGKGEVWDAIVEENGLVRTRLVDITCFEAVYVIVNFAFQHVSCMCKSREFGFNGSVDTLKSVRKWVERLGDMKIIPKVLDSSSAAKPKQ